jgi:hypothetical protein
MLTILQYFKLMQRNNPMSHHKWSMIFQPSQFNFVKISPLLESERKRTSAYLRMRNIPMSKISLIQLAGWPIKLACIVRSIDMVGYQALVVIDDQELLLVGKDDKPLSLPSLMHMREVLKKMPLSSLTLRHEPAYEEMINQPQGGDGNMLEVSLSLNPYPFTQQDIT